MSLGTGALQVGRGPEQFRHSREVSMATLQAGTAQFHDSPRCLERGGAREQGWQGTSDFPPNHPKHHGDPTQYQTN